MKRSTNNDPKVLCAGLMVCDILVKPVLPEFIGRDSAEVEHIGLAGGGDAFNVASNLAALGVPVSLASRAGNDELGAWLLNKVRARGINDHIPLLDGARTSTSVVAIRPDSERTFLLYRGACHTMPQEDVTDAMLARHDIFYLGSAFDLPGMDKCNGIATLLERARRQGLFTVLDLTTDLTPAHLDILKPALPWVSLFMPSRGEALGLTGKTNPADAARVFQSMGCGSVVVKLGAKGCLVLTDENCTTHPAYPARVVDTTGAGDAFVAAFIAGLVKGLPMETCARLGNAAGSVCVTVIGANGALQNFEQLEKII